MGRIYDIILDNKKRGRKMVALLIDPDRCSTLHLDTLFASGAEKADIILVGGSLVANDTDATVRSIQSRTQKPVVLFPGSSTQLSPSADALLMLSLISGRNAEFLIGQHVTAAPTIARYNLETIPTGYMLIDGGSPTSVEYMSNTRPIPHSKDDIAVATALAGTQLGLRMIYLEGGSGAHTPVSASMISKVRAHISVPIIVGGGLRTPESAAAACSAGADIVVIGTAVERSPQLIAQICDAVHAI